MSEPVIANGTFSYSGDAVKACLGALFGTHMHPSPESSSFELDLPPRAVAELAATPVNSLDLTAKDERWFPSCRARLELRPIGGKRTGLTIRAKIVQANGAIPEPHFERTVAEAALQAIIHIIHRDLRHTAKEY